jgi:hypothetical protein
MLDVDKTHVPHSSGGWKSQVRVLAGLGSGEGPLLPCRLPSSLHSHMVGGKGRALYGSLFNKKTQQKPTLIPFLRAPPSCP